MKALKIALLLAGLGLLGLTAACHSGTPPNFDELTPDVQGSFVNAQLYKAQGAPAYSACPTAANQIDSRLQVGDVFQTLYEAINGDKPKRILTVSARITAVSTSSLTEQLTPSGSAGVSEVSLSASGAMTCAVTGSSPGCQPPAFINVMAPYTNGRYSSCIIDPDEGAQVTPTVYSGQYKLSDGQQVTAYKITTTYQGVVTCDGLSIGEGSQTTITVTSQDVPAEGAITSCGGTPLLVFNATKNADGRVLVGSLQERLSIP